MKIRGADLPRAKNRTLPLGSMCVFSKSTRVMGWLYQILDPAMVKPEEKQTWSVPSQPPLPQQEALEVSESGSLFRKSELVPGTLSLVQKSEVK